MKPQAKIDHPLDVTAGASLEVLAWEIELAGARCIFLDALIGELMSELPPERRGRLMEGLHAVDLLSQHLTGLSAFARSLSQTMPTEITAPVEHALAEVSLGVLADRLRTAFGGEEQHEADDTGDLDLF